MEDNQSIELICDYLRNPDVGHKQNAGKARNKKRYGKLQGLDKRIKKPGTLGELIVQHYYKILGYEYKKYKRSNQDTYYIYTNALGNEIEVRPDGLLRTTDNQEYYVEVKTRGYYSTGTADEKIPYVPLKYNRAGKKIILFLLCDDEHKFNKEWTALLRGQIQPVNEMQKLRVQSDKLVIHKIILGTEVAEVLEKSIKKF